MNILIKKAKIIDSKSPYHLQIVDLLIEKGVITQIAKNISKKTQKTIEKENLHVSPGWIDIGAMCWEPGKEYREDIQSLKEAAANGGYTKVLIWPNTDSIIDSKAQYQYFTNQNFDSAVKLLPICSVTKKCEGIELAEILDLYKAGATLFSDGLTFKGKDKELYKALEYVKSIDARILYTPNPFKIYPDGQVHESHVSISLGVQGLPSSSEKIDLQKVISLAEYANSECIIHNVSSEEGIKECKSKNIAALGTSYLNLCKNVDDLSSFNTNCKVIPPIRDISDRNALLKAVENDKIDYISSNHFPLEKDIKEMEFGLARFGASGIETTFAGLRTETDLTLEKIIEKLTYGPAKAAQVEIGSLEINNQASLTLFDPDGMWTYDHTTCKSKAKNNPYYDHELKGQVFGVIHNDQIST